MIAGLALRLLTELDSFLGAEIDASHAVSALISPHRNIILHGDISQGTDTRAHRASYAFIRSIEILCGDKELIVEGKAHLGDDIVRDLALSLFKRFG